MAYRLRRSRLAFCGRLPAKRSLKASASTSRLGLGATMTPRARLCSRAPLLIGADCGLRWTPSTTSGALAPFAGVPDPVNARWQDLVGILASMPDTPLSTVANGGTRQGAEFVLGTVQLGLPYGRANTSGMPDQVRRKRSCDARWSMASARLDTAHDTEKARLASAGSKSGGEGRVTVTTKLSPLPVCRKIRLMRGAGDGGRKYLRVMPIPPERTPAGRVAAPDEPLAGFRRAGLGTAEGATVTRSDRATWMLGAGPAGDVSGNCDGWRRSHPAALQPSGSPMGCLCTHSR